MSQNIFALRPKCQTYAWGKDATSSIVAQFMAKNDPSFVIDGAQNYAELWMGTHPKGPASLIIGDQAVSLNEWVKENSSSLGDRVLSRFGAELPFLLKILSIRTALSIQAHPNKKHAEQLFSSDPKNYPDDNHKPEMIIALTPMKALCGFRPLSEIATFMRSNDVLRSVVGEAASSKLLASFQSETEGRAALVECFRELMVRDKAAVKAAVTVLVDAITHGVVEQQSVADHWALVLNEQYPGDVGCFCVYFLNIVELQTGEALFLGPNIPHAYLTGDGIECMSRGDNVVRAGCTEKFRDVTTLCEMLTYQTGPATNYMVQPTADALQQGVVTYDTPVDEFKVSVMKISGDSNGNFAAQNAPSIILVTDGSGVATVNSQTVQLRAGSVYFVTSNQEINVKSDADGITIFRAYC